jgi:hypothetical protein
MLGTVRKWRAARKERKRRAYAEALGATDPAEVQRLRGQQSPMKAKWGFFPK